MRLIGQTRNGWRVLTANDDEAKTYDVECVRCGDDMRAPYSVVRARKCECRLKRPTTRPMADDAEEAIVDASRQYMDDHTCRWLVREFGSFPMDDIAKLMGISERQAWVIYERAVKNATNRARGMRNLESLYEQSVRRASRYVVDYFGELEAEEEGLHVVEYDEDEAA